MPGAPSKVLKTDIKGKTSRISKFEKDRDYIEEACLYKFAACLLAKSLNVFECH